MAGNAGQRNTSLLTSFTESSVHSTSQGSLHTHTHTHRTLRHSQAFPGAGTTDHSSRKHVPWSVSHQSCLARALLQSLSPACFMPKGYTHLLLNENIVMTIIFSHQGHLRPKTNVRIRIVTDEVILTIAGRPHHLQDRGFGEACGVACQY
ncbi:hypothetical protein E2C01_032825 [Portunus trituberculatus]|uniref:Uncharacterized protein n=1 Tax=Portunus trituberculatus TaxID=210409 RepID=A0A5B7F3Y1_PORTR|nr:hypothetical protein [Portunus trituberculatus]